METIFNNLALIVNLIIAIPTAGFVISLLIPEKNEFLLSRSAMLTALLTFISAIGLIVFWGMNGFVSLNVKEIALYKSEEYTFLIDLYFDRVTAVYLFVGSFLTLLITVYSRYYLHREKGYKRFFNTILFFFVGYNITIFAGNFETLFVGWEILGLSSFLLIAFYRERYLPVRNAMRVFSIYRIGDVGIILAMWASHHLWEANVTFIQLENQMNVHQHLVGHSAAAIFISLMIVLAAAVKSAQFPFSSWLARAMEGPTPSSAIFYGSLSVHFGAFLLMRTFPYWQEQTFIRVAVILLGLSSALVAAPIARIQSSIKSKVAYASIVQIGLIFIEIALGLEMLALIHFAGNAFLRTYQLLVSPSVVAYRIREQFYNFSIRTQPIVGTYWKKWEYTIYQLSLREFQLDTIINKSVFSRIKKLGKNLSFINFNNVFFVFVPLYLLGIIAFIYRDRFDPFVLNYLPEALSFIGLLMVFRAFGERKSPFLAWTLLMMSNFWSVLAAAFNSGISWVEFAFYLSGVVVLGVFGLVVLNILKSKEPKFFSLNGYFGHSYQHPRLAFVFLICCLGIMGFPITPTFIGEDLLFSHIEEKQIFLAIFNALSYIIGGISVLRIYARLFLGQHCKTFHPTALQAS
jgi:NADH:ubiquinone oxidoreductase subunit 5 (subunit L)/multisubunit Na+/H+ antiporter MnhA subunit